MKKAKLPLPETQTRFGKHRVDFYWPGLELVVETDGGRFHATPAQQAHKQVFYAPAETTALLVDVVQAKSLAG